MSQIVNHPLGLSTFGRLRNVVTACVTLGLFAVAAPLVHAAPGDVTGTYADKGVVVQSTDGEAAFEAISFHALLSQQFSPALSAADFPTSARFELNDETDRLVLEIFNDDGKSLWRALWGASRGFSHEDGKAVLRIQRRGSKDQRYSYVLEPADDDGNLLVTVYLVKATTFGPGADLVGSYMFVPLN
ncbi:hypothetical protein [Actomonas aquatica]|uniref:Uncharacterized protein n=1 Tax=Actomonas aquatica TaxID=2866162 RepID=A0ABZ1CCY1_9BACT|nr:hypothetical protein [Opitutus sp. WL0086]WRQ89515.1 hypothetical protein K1X11_008840 [Opitutus sp. WL0086]